MASESTLEDAIFKNNTVLIQAYSDDEGEEVDIKTDDDDSDFSLTDNGIEQPIVKGSSRKAKEPAKPTEEQSVAVEIGKLSITKPQGEETSDKGNSYNDLKAKETIASTSSTSTAAPFVGSSAMSKDDFKAIIKESRSSHRENARLFKKYPMLEAGNGTPAYVLAEIERLQDEYAADPDALQEVERGLRWYLKIGGGGQWLELSRLKYPHRAKGKRHAVEEFCFVPLNDNLHYTNWEPRANYGGFPKDEEAVVEDEASVGDRSEHDYQYNELYEDEYGEEYDEEGEDSVTVKDGASGSESDAALAELPVKSAKGKGNKKKVTVEGDLSDSSPAVMEPEPVSSSGYESDESAGNGSDLSDLGHMFP